MMKKLLVLSAIVLCFATLNENATGQTKSKSNFFAGAPGEKRVEIQNQTASSDGQNGALIEWQTSYEINNLGFNVYRLSNTGKRVLVNENLVAGSAMMFGNDTALKAGFSYSLYDKNGSLDNQYLIEAVTTDEKTQNFSNFNTNYFADFKQFVPESASANDKNVSNLTANNLSQNVNPAPLASEQKANSL
ncbi:MAG: hypothetical protein H7Z37_12745, partial [Pyrinomonadaceae bacterium]|nr:hypothetical protein [Pyrinomonadaceae bacterium]